MQHAVMRVTSESIFGCLVSVFPLSPAFAVCSLTQKPHDCVESLVSFLFLTSYIHIPGHTPPVSSGLCVPIECNSHELLLLPLCCLCTDSMASVRALMCVGMIQASCRDWCT